MQGIKIIETIFHKGATSFPFVSSNQQKQLIIEEI